MKNFLKIEQLAILVAAIMIYYKLDYSWLWFAILFLSPDIFMISYLFGNKVGAISYNFIHSYILTIGLALIGYFFKIEWCIMLGLIFTAHAALDRFLGFGLKTFEGFKFTHLNKL